jgi:hypothetical protein
VRTLRAGRPHRWSGAVIDPSRARIATREECERLRLTALADKIESEAASAAPDTAYERVSIDRLVGTALRCTERDFEHE